MFYQRILILFFSLFLGCTSSKDSIKEPDPTAGKALESKNKEADKSPKGNDSFSKYGTLPLPDKSTYFHVKSFYEENRDLYMNYMPLSREYGMYFQVLNSKDAEREDEIEALKTRLAEDYARTHWVYLNGVLELMDYLSDDGQNFFQSDKEKNFVARMKVLTFVAKSLSEISSDKKYLSFLRSVYVSLSEKHFGRALLVEPAPAPK
jgi:hypothetical protein